MNHTAMQVLERLQAAFPQRATLGVVTLHECEECSSIRRHLEGRTWGEVSNEFAEAFAGSLPLLSADAYNAYLPVWLRAAVTNPDGEAASMIAINLSDEPSHTGFTQDQAATLIAVVEYIANNNRWGIDDPANAKAIKGVKAEWSNGAA